MRRSVVTFLGLLGAIGGLLAPFPYAEPVAAQARGTVRAWGANASGQLGDGTNIPRSSPVQVSGISGASALAAGSLHSVAVKADGTAWAWGDNRFGQLGDGTVAPRFTPVQISGLSGVAAGAAGFGHSLAAKSDGTAWAWGSNGFGQLGDGNVSTVPRTSPGQVSGLTGVTAVAAGAFFSLALKTDGTVWTWGDNDYGQLGDGTTTRRPSPVQVSGLTAVVAIAAGRNHSLAIRSDGTLWAWGDNTSGQLGDGSTTLRSTPVRVTGLSGVAAVAGGARHSLAMRSDGTASAWGDNASGQLGDGTTTNRTTPVQVSGLSGVAALAAGERHSLVARSDGTASAWGDNTSGQLGDGTTTNRTSPVSVSALSAATAVAAGSTHSLALVSEGPGGRNFTLTSAGAGSVRLAWQPGTTQASYALFRFTTAGVTALPSPSASATSATDTVPASDTLACYLLQALSSTGSVLGQGDPLCIIPRVASGSTPGSFSLQLRQSNTASLSWASVSGASGYALLPLGTARLQSLAATAITATDATGGAPTCYILFAVAGGAAIGWTDLLCGAPGRSLGFAGR